MKKILFISDPRGDKADIAPMVVNYDPTTRKMSGTVAAYYGLAMHVGKEYHNCQLNNESVAVRIIEATLCSTVGIYDIVNYVIQIID